MTTGGDDLRVDAGAEKRFFIEMLVKDIELLPALVDLVDNSVDGARALKPQGASLAEHWVHITVDAEKCRIEDNSGGIELGLARAYAFRFGRSANFKGTKRSVGQFGIGMKRAMFKIGGHFCVESTFAGNDGSDHLLASQFMLDVDVDEWARDPEWIFTLTDARSDYQLGPTEFGGTTIEITNLHPSVSDDFASPLTMKNLANELRVRHQEAIQAGLEIKLNAETLAPTRLVLQSSDLIKPIHRKMTITVDGGEVEAVVMAGTVRPAGGRGSEEPLDDGDAENFPEPGEAGWYLFCNDRLLVSADRTSLTGWGDPAAAYHPQYRLFRGYAYLNADDASLLPWNTTKTAVDRDSLVFRRVQSEMKTALKEVQAAINRLKTDRERRQEEETEPTDLDAAFASAEEVSLRDLKPSEKLVVPPTPSRPRPSKSQERRITYAVAKDAYAEVYEDLGASSAAEVGRLTFEYYVASELNP
ncbi:MAG: ATP-binding protein [Nocardioides sp.]